MACNCGKKKIYLVTTASGQKVEVPDLTSAMTLVRREGGHYERVSK